MFSFFLRRFLCFPVWFSSWDFSSSGQRFCLLELQNWIKLLVQLYFHYCFESPKLTVKLVHHEFLRLHLTCLKNSRIAERRQILFCYLFISCTNPLRDLVFSPLIECFVGSMFVHMVFHFIPTHIWGIKSVGITSKFIGKDHEEIPRERRLKNAGT